MSGGKVLVVEDERDLRDVYSIILKRAGYQVSEAANGQDALAVVKDFEPDLILLDIFMPVMDGKLFLENLDTSKYPKTKIIVCSNTADQGLMDGMLKLGATKVVTKANLAPSDLTALVAPYLTK